MAAELVKLINDNVLADLETAVNAFLPTTTTVVSISYQATMTSLVAGNPVVEYSVCIVYT